MTINELANELEQMYHSGNGNKTAMIHLFGIKYAEIIRENGYTPRELLELANMRESYFAEINKGIKLAEFVEVKDKYK